MTTAPAIPALLAATRPTDEQLRVLEEGLPDQPKEASRLLTGQAVNSWLLARASPAPSTT